MYILSGIKPEIPLSDTNTKHKSLGYLNFLKVETRSERNTFKTELACGNRIQVQRYFKSLYGV